MMTLSDPSAKDIPPPESLKKRAAKGAIWISIETIGMQITSFVVFATMARYIGPRDFGLISICFLAIQSLQMLVLYNLATVAARKQHAVELDYTTTFWITLGIAALAFLGLLVGAHGAERLFKAPGLAPVLRAMSVIVLFMGLARTHETWLVRHFKFKSLAFRSLIGVAAGGIIGLALAVKGFGVMALVGQQITTSVISVILLWIACPWRPSFHFSRSTALEIAMFMRSIMPNNIVYALNQNCDTFLVAFFFGPVSAGIFNIAKRVRLALQVAGDPIKVIAFPTLAEMQHDPERMRRGVLNFLALICALCGPVFFGASAVAPEAISVVFGQKWMASAPVLQGLSLGGLAMVLTAYNDNIFLLKDRPVWCLYGSLAYAGLATAMFLVFAALKVDALALPFILPYLIVFPISAALVSRRIALSWRDWVWAMLPGIGSSTLMYVAILLVRMQLPAMDDRARLAVLCCVGVVSYPIILWCVGRKTVEQIIDIARHVVRG